MPKVTKKLIFTAIWLVLTSFIIKLNASEAELPYTTQQMWLTLTTKAKEIFRTQPSDSLSRRITFKTDKHACLIEYEFKKRALMPQDIDNLFSLVQLNLPEHTNLFAVTDGYEEGQEVKIIIVFPRLWSEATEKKSLSSTLLQHTYNIDALN